MKKKTLIRDRNNKPTQYYPAGKTIIIQGIGEFASLIKRMWDEEGESEQAFKLAAITADFVYYVDEEEGDDNANVVMLDRDIRLVSDNYFGCNSLAELVEKNEGFLWMSDAVEYWQREQFVKRGQITEEIKKKLEAIDVEKLTAKEKGIYFAYLHNGPVKYTKPESLMAAMSNDLSQDKHSDELTTIMTILEKDED